IDPVCGMTVEVSGARYTHEHEGVAYYFCCPGCRKSFSDDPGAFLGS
ncbi:MAG: YHS domain-containing protein, partial [Actinobacteria bacterium]|nr:YHS domain-containing protein [Actinomycetota bacterium]NIS30803.1 YHS domain-containing protein [Actinomycetota bacterium]NIT95309.1 YHS domain-containing protein [Actinomycetota bacterium]NIU18982.1 YHS domain-containing protein [Actinomycetota bacterium]NIU66001.1 YHS domain-containing protein [Actinomycetota bacterium]